MTGLRARTMDDEGIRARRLAPDLFQQTHFRHNLHRRPEEVNGVTTGLAQRSGAFDDGDLEAVLT